MAESENRSFIIHSSLMTSPPTTETEPIEIGIYGDAFVANLSTNVVDQIVTAYKIYYSDTIPKLTINKTTDGKIYKVSFYLKENYSEEPELVELDYEEDDILLYVTRFNSDSDYSNISPILEEIEITQGLHAATADSDSRGNEIPTLTPAFDEAGIRFTCSGGETVFSPEHSWSEIGTVAVAPTDTFYPQDSENSKSPQRGYAYKYLNQKKFNCHLTTIPLLTNTVQKITVGTSTYYYWQDYHSGLFDAISKDATYKMFSSDGSSGNGDASEISSPIYPEKQILTLRWGDYLYIKQIEVGTEQSLSNIWLFLEDSETPSTQAPTEDMIITVSNFVSLKFKTNPTALFDEDIPYITGKTPELFDTIQEGNLYQVDGVDGITSVEAYSFLDPFTWEQPVLGLCLRTSYNIGSYIYYIKSITLNDVDYEDIWCWRWEEPIDIPSLSIIGGPPLIKSFDSKYLDANYTRENIDVFASRTTSINGADISVYGASIPKDQEYSPDDLSSTEAIPLVLVEPNYNPQFSSASAFGYSLPLAYQLLQQDYNAEIDLYIKLDNNTFIKCDAELIKYNISDNPDRYSKAVSFSGRDANGNIILQGMYRAFSDHGNDVGNWEGDWSYQCDFWRFSIIPSNTKTFTVAAVIKNGKYYPHAIGLGCNNKRGGYFENHESLYSRSPYIVNYSIINGFSNDYYVYSTDVKQSGTITIPQIGMFAGGTYDFYPNISSYTAGSDFSTCTGAYAYISYSDDTPNTVIRLSSREAGDMCGGRHALQDGFEIWLNAFANSTDHIRYFADALLIKYPSQEIKDKITNFTIISADCYNPEYYWEENYKKINNHQFIENPYGNLINGDISLAEPADMVAVPPNILGYNNLIKNYEGEIVYNESEEKFEGVIDNYSVIVGNGVYLDSDSNPIKSNAATLTQSGNLWISRDIYVGSNSGTHRDEGSKKVLTQNNKITASENVIIRLLDSQKNENGIISAFPEFMIQETDLGSAIQINSDNTIIGDLSDSPVIGNMSTKSTISSIINGPFVGTLNTSNISVTPFIATNDSHITSKKYVDTQLSSLLPTFTASDIGKVLGVIDDGSGNPILAWVNKT